MPEANDPARQYVAVAVMHRDDKLLLVRQQGPEDADPYWSLPGGSVHQDEFLIQGLAREIYEETGLTILNVGELAYTVRIDNPAEGLASTTRAFEITAWRGQLHPRDLDRYALAAEFVARPEISSRIESIPYQHMRQPLLAYVQGRAPKGAVWLYRQEAGSQTKLITCLAGGGAASPAIVERGEFR